MTAPKQSTLAIPMTALITAIRTYLSEPITLPLWMVFIGSMGVLTILVFGLAFFWFYLEGRLMDEDEDSDK